MSSTNYMHNGSPFVAGSTNNIATIAPRLEMVEHGDVEVTTIRDPVVEVVNHDQRIELWEESKRTRQRKMQRLAKTAFKTKSEDWPMKVPTTLKGEIEEGYRVFVHRIFRATARRFLKVHVIKFKKHPPRDIERVKDLLEKCFIFTPPIDNDYILKNIEKAMASCRYQWHKYWKSTGMGEKHEQCPKESFPSLVCYWRTLEAEEESRALEQERLQSKATQDHGIKHGVPSQFLNNPWNVKNHF